MTGRFTHAQPVIAGTFPGTTSTAGASRITLNVKIQTGNSSGGGDMADVLGGDLNPSAQNYYSSANSTDHPSFTTGNIRLQYSPTCFPIQSCGRFVKAVGTVTRVGIATSTAAGNLVTCHLGMNLIKQDEELSTLKNLSFEPGGLLASRRTTATTT